MTEEIVKVVLPRGAKLTKERPRAQVVTQVVAERPPGGDCYSTPTYNFGDQRLRFSKPSRLPVGSLILWQDRAYERDVPSHMTPMLAYQSILYLVCKGGRLEPIVDVVGYEETWRFIALVSEKLLSMPDKMIELAQIDHEMFQSVLKELSHKEGKDDNV